MDVEELKRQAAEKAVSFIQPDMVVGLGTGSTTRHAVIALARRMKDERFSVVGVSTSERTTMQALKLGIPIKTLEEQPEIDLAIDGADEVEKNSLALIKGGGGALLREKIVEAAAKRLIIIADESKLVDRLGTTFKVPVEVVRFGWKNTLERVQALGCVPELRTGDDGEPFVTDEQHYLLDCRFAPIADPAALAGRLKALVGVVEHGLFVGMAEQAIIASASGIRVYRAE